MKLSTSQPVQCPSCRPLLGKRLPDGRVEVRQGDYLRVVVRQGSMDCPRVRDLRLGPARREPADLRVLAE